MIRIGMLLSDRYEILEKIGSGGMSDVYKAKCHKLNRLVAVKVLKQEYSADKNFVSKFWAEAQSAAGLAHSNIVNIYDVGNEQSIYYIVMELVEGITLKKYIEKKEKLEVRESIGIAMQVCQGIEAAHEQKIIHRDIKPQNIMISKDGKVKVTDFGIARAATTQTISSNAMGSVHYISPEQARGGYCDERSDIYSMGIVMYEMLTGCVPFEGESTVQVALMHIQTEMVPPTMHEPTIPVSLEKIILKCTQKKPEARYASVAALIADLRRALMTPDEDFVKIIPVVTSNDPTRVMSNEEVEQIKSEARITAVPTVDKEEEAYLMGYEDDEELEEMDEVIEEEDDEEESDPKFEKIITGVSIAVAILIVILAVFILGRALNLFGGGDDDETLPGTTTTEAPATTEDSKTAVMPKLVGLTLGEAEELLTERGLGISVEYVAAPDSEQGIVLSQEFDEGATVNKHYRVGVVVCDNTGIADVPTGLVGSSFDAVRKALLNAGFKVNPVQEYSDDVADGIVISIDPEEGTVGLPTGTTIEVVVSKGPEVIMVVVPKVVGEMRVNAEADLKMKGLKVTVEEAFDDEVVAGVVISQSPANGKSVEMGSTVTIVVSKGADKVKVPSLLGMTLDEAKEELEKVGLKLDSTYDEEFSATVKLGQVMQQSVEVDTKVEKDSVIKVTLSKGPENVVVPELKGTEQEMEKTLKDMGLILEVKKASSATVAAGGIISVATKEGDPVVPGTTIVPGGSTIVVTISEGQVMVTIPKDLIGQNGADVKTALVELGLIVKLEKIPHDNIAMDKVISVNPASGTSVAKGSEVTLTVSDGQQQVDVPNLSGMNKKEAEDAVKAAGLNFKEGEAVYHSTIADGIVVSWSDSEAKVNKGTIITVVFSKGPEPVQTVVVPDLSGKNETEAQSALEGVGLVYKKGTEEYSNIEKGKVISWSQKDATVDVGTTITVNFSKGLESTTAAPESTTSASSEE